MEKWNKFIKQGDARRLSKIFCEDFEIDYCQVYYVDNLENGAYGEYVWLYRPHILILDKPENLNPIGVLMHELNHHIQYQLYDLSENHHGYEWNLAKRRTINWCERNISKKSDWTLPLKARQDMEKMKTFRI